MTGEIFIAVCEVMGVRVTDLTPTRHGRKMDAVTRPLTFLLVVGAMISAGPGYAGFKPPQPDPLAEELVVPAPDWAIMDGRPDDDFARAVVNVGDIDGDGFDEIAIGVPSAGDEVLRPGRVYLYTTTLEGLSEAPIWAMDGADEELLVFDQPILSISIGIEHTVTSVWPVTYHVPGESFGKALAGGDLNGDGFADLVIGAPTHSDTHTNQGRVAVYMGSANGLGKTPDWEAKGEVHQAEFGLSVASGFDLNGDGFHDLAVGSPFAGMKGWVYIYYGSTNGLQKEAASKLVLDRWSARLGWSLLSCNFNGDDYDDLIVAAIKGGPVRGGGIHFMPGGPDGIATNAAWTYHCPLKHFRVGRCLESMGDLNGDGCDDFAAGAGGDNMASHREYGAAMMFYGSPSNEGFRVVELWKSPQQISSLGKAIANVGDVTGDGRNDIAIAEAFHDVNKKDQGLITVYETTETGLGEPYWTAIGTEVGLWLGSTVFAIDINNDERKELLAVCGVLEGGSKTARLYGWNSLKPGNETVPFAAVPIKDITYEREIEWRWYKDQSHKMKWSTTSQFLTHDELIEVALEIEPLLAKGHRFADEARHYHSPRRVEGEIAYEFATDPALVHEAYSHLMKAIIAAEKEHHLSDPEDRWYPLMMAAEYFAEIDFLFRTVGRGGRSAMFETLYRNCWKLAEAEAAEHKPNNMPMYNHTLEWLWEAEAYNYMDVCQYDNALTCAQESLRYGMYNVAKFDLNYGHILVADIHMSMERYHQALAAHQKCIDVDFPPQRSNNAISMAYHLAMLHGPSDELREWLNKNQEGRKRLGSGIISRKAHALWILGEKEQAMDELSDLVAYSRKTDDKSGLATALLVRGQLHVEADKFAEAVADSKAALLALRESGMRGMEISAYECQADALHGMEEYDSAVRTWENGFDLCERLGLKHMALRMLIGNLKTHLAIDDLMGASLIVDRMDKLLSEHPDMPEPTMLAYHIVKCEFLKFAGYGADYNDQYAAMKRFIEKSTLTTYQLREVPPFDPNAAEAGREAGTMRRLRPVLLQPVRITSQVLPGETARGRFVLYNPNSTNAAGDVFFEGVSALEWTDTNGVWRAKLTAGKAQSRSLKTRVAVPPNEGLEIMLTTELSDSVEESSEVSIQWRGDSSTNASWVFGPAEEALETAVVCASFEAENPFFYTAFYNEIYYRGEGDAVRNIGIVASQPVRIELVDKESQTVLAVDANGDGDYEDIGDQVYQDADMDMYPDLSFSEIDNAAAIELLVYPVGDDSEPRTEPVDLTIYVRTPDGWEERAVNTLL